MAPRRGRQFWERIVREVERGGATHAEVAARHGVPVGSLRSWIYRLRRDERRTARRNVRVLPVEIVASDVRPRSIDVRAASGEVVTFDEGTDVAYIVALIAALRTAPC